MRSFRYVFARLGASERFSLLAHIVFFISITASTIAKVFAAITDLLDTLEYDITQIWPGHIAFGRYQCFAQSTLFCAEHEELRSAPDWGTLWAVCGEALLVAFLSIGIIVLIIAVRKQTLLFLAQAIDSLGQHEIIEADHGSSIKDVIVKTRLEPVEYISIFGADHGKFSEVTTLHRSKVDISRIELSCEESRMITIHNHPFQNSSFSSNDLRFFIYNKIGSNIVIARRTVYFLDIPDTCWSLDRKEVGDYHAAVFNRKATSFSPALRFFCTDYCTTICSRAACEAVAEKYGMTFRMEKYWTWRCRQIWSSWQPRRAQIWTQVKTVLMFR